MAAIPVINCDHLALLLFDFQDSVPSNLPDAELVVAETHAPWTLPGRPACRCCLSASASRTRTTVGYRRGIRPSVHVRSSGTATRGRSETSIIDRLAPQADDLV
jgi:hypothetical protein